MTDNAVTDGDPRNARLWAEKVGPPSVSPGYIGTPSEIHNAARVILATVDAPALSEELGYRAALLDNGDPDGDSPQALRDLATRAERMERELAEARDEVERLTAENEELRRTDNYKEFRERFLAVKKRLDPADVPPGEAWLVDVDGERRPAVKDGEDYFPWNAINGRGWIYSVRNEDVTLITRLVPAPRVITDPEELDKLAPTSIFRDGSGWPGGITDQGKVMRANGTALDATDWIRLYGPVTVLWEPEA